MVTAPREGCTLDPRLTVARSAGTLPGFLGGPVFRRLVPAAAFLAFAACSCEDNQKPSFAGNAEIHQAREGETVAFSVTATDPDEGQTVAVTLQDLNDPPTSAVIQPSGAFTWVVPDGTR